MARTPILCLVPTHSTTDTGRCTHVSAPTPTHMAHEPHEQGECRTRQVVLARIAKYRTKERAHAT
eukprot:3519769-Alexandrium_andersonii.AAC.1